MRALGLGLTLYVLIAPVVPAQGAERPPRTVGVHRKDGRLGVSVGLRDLLWPSDGERLRSGFASRVVIRIELWRQDLAQPVAWQIRRSEVVYDIWDEKFRVQVFEGASTTPLRRQVRALEEAVDVATALRGFAITDLSRLTPGARYRFRFRADLNPLSEELVSDVRSWLKRPPTQGRGGAGESFFGSFVSIFVNPQIEESERQLSFWSQEFTEPRR